MGSQIIDACAQLGSGDKKGDLLEFGITSSRVVENMEQAGVAKSVIFPVTWSRYTDQANREIHEAVRKYPDRFIGFARVNPAEVGAEKLLEKALEDWGLHGVRLRPYHDGFELKDPKVKKIMDIAQEHRIPIATDGEKEKSALFRIVNDYPDVPVILMHLGSFDNWVWQNGKAYMDLLEKADNFFMASCFEIIHFFLEEAIKRSPEKVVFGSDSPNLPPSMELKRIEVMKLDSEQHALVVGGTLAKILKL
jgi:predicted TIM-barrel fold metal-dependent hydrolase